VEGLGRSVGCIGEVWMGGSQVTCKFIERDVPNEDTRGDINYTVICVELLDSGASLRRVTFSENLLKVTEE
jgi:hypothetical protein